MDPQWQKLIDQIIEQGRGAARFRWWALLAAWVVCLSGWLFIATRPNVFSAEARVYVDTRTSLAPVLQGLTINQDIYAQISRVRQSLVGRAQLEQIASEAGLDRNVSTPEEKDRLIALIGNSVGINGWDSGTGMMFQIAYSSPSRDTSLKVVDILLNTFVSETLGGNSARERTAQDFLRLQIQEYDQKLRQAEQRLADFKRRNVGQMPGAQGDFFSRLHAQMQVVDKLQSQLIVEMTRREELLRQLQSGRDDTESLIVADSDSPTAIAITEAEGRLQELLLRYTDKHPDVVAARETLTQLRLRQSRELDAAVHHGSLATGASSNPVVQKIQQSLNETEVEIAALRSELTDNQRAVSELRALVNVVPDVEAEYTRLNRDYDVTTAQYNELVARLDKAQLGQEAESTESVKFEIVTPPTAGFVPVAPNRPRLMTFTMIAGLGLGGGLAWLLHMLRPVFHSSQALHEFTGYPVLGVVSMTWLDRYKRHQLKSYATFSVGVLGLIAVLVGLLQLQSLMPFG